MSTDKSDNITNRWLTFLAGCAGCASSGQTEAMRAAFFSGATAVFVLMTEVIMHESPERAAQLGRELLTFMQPDRADTMRARSAKH